LKNKSKIYRALLKNGYSNFKLNILEYCDPSVLILREQYYLDTLNPSYNILKFAGSLKGFKHSKASLKSMSKAGLGRILNEE
jgi:group I intron endonuclease